MNTKRFISIIALTVAASNLSAQDKSLPYYEIPSYPAEYTAATVAARLIDGVGFRYYWATEGLRDQDLVFKPGPEARTTQETLIHIYRLSEVIVNSTKKVTTNVDVEVPKISFAEMRKLTLLNLKTASDLLKVAPNADLNDYKMKFINNKSSNEFPFWNELNGPIADALWHIGQVVSFRRSSGNPFNSKVSVMQGKLLE